MNRSFRNVEGVVLAAGFSSRAGGFKMTLPLPDGKPLIRHTVETMLQFCSSVIVVGGYEIGKIINAVESYSRVRVVENPDYRTGMFSSVKEGVRHIAADLFFFIPGDYPLIHPETYAVLLNAAETEPGAPVFVPVYNGRKGHPVLARRQLADKILKEPVSSTLKHVIARTGFTGVPVTDPGILKDIDTPEDYRRLLVTRGR